MSLKVHPVLLEQAEQGAVRHVVERRPQAAVVVILKRDEAERLQHSLGRLPRRSEDLGHAVDRPRLRLKRQFDEGTVPQRTRQLQQSASRGNGLEFSFCAPAIF